MDSKDLSSGRLLSSVSPKATNVVLQSGNHSAEVNLIAIQDIKCWCANYGRGEDDYQVCIAPPAQAQGTVSCLISGHLRATHTEFDPEGGPVFLVRIHESSQAKDWAFNNCSYGSLPFPPLCCLATSLRRLITVNSSSLSVPCLGPGNCWKDMKAPPVWTIFSLRTWTQNQQPSFLPPPRPKYKMMIFYSFILLFKPLLPTSAPFQLLSTPS